MSFQGRSPLANSRQHRAGEGLSFFALALSPSNVLIGTDWSDGSRPVSGAIDLWGASALDGSAARFATLDLATARSNAVFALARETNGEGNAADSIRFKRPLRKRALRAFRDSRLRRTRFRSSSMRAGLPNAAVNWYNVGVMVSNVTATGVFGETRFDAFRRATVSVERAFEEDRVSSLSYSLSTGRMFTVSLTRDARRPDLVVDRDHIHGSRRVYRYETETGDIAAEYVYDPYGNVLETCGTNADLFSIGFSTKHQDRETGLVSYQRRFYNPELGRWINRDPIEEEGGRNLFCFSMNRPSSTIDVRGQFAVYVHADGMVGHVGLRVANGVAYDYGRYHGTYSGLGLAFAGPNVLKTNQRENIVASHSYKVFDFKVCKVLDDKVLDEGIEKAAVSRFESGMQDWPNVEKFNSFLELEVNERYMGTDWSWNSDNCITFTFRTIVAGINEARKKGPLPSKAKRQAVARILLAEDSCWQTRPAAVKNLLERYSRSADWIAESE